MDPKRIVDPGHGRRCAGFERDANERSLRWAGFALELSETKNERRRAAAKSRSIA